MKHFFNIASGKLPATFLAAVGILSATAVAFGIGRTEMEPLGTSAVKLQQPEKWTSYPRSGQVQMPASARESSPVSEAVRRAATDDSGAIIPPYVETFDVKADFTNNFVLENPDGGNKWMWSNKALRSPISYSGKGPNNAWVIFPAMRLEAGKGYRLTLNAKRANATSEETFNIKLGTEQKAAACNIMVAENVKLPQAPTANDSVSVDAIMRVDTAGVYYMAIQWTSPEANKYVYFDNIIVSAPQDMGMPEAVTDLAVTPDEAGAHKAAIGFRTPAKDLNGKALASIAKAEILRNDTLVKSIDNPAVDTPVSFVDEVPAAGEYTYKVVVSNDKGSSKPVEKSAYIGVDYPDVVTDLVLRETETYGTVNLTWKAPATDVNGRALDPSKVHYEVRQNTSSYPLIGTTKPGVTGVSFKMNNPETEQLFLSVVVVPFTERGSGKGTSSPLIPVGNPYVLPYQDSFGKSGSHNMAVQNISGGGQWVAFSDNDDLTDADGTGGYLGYVAQNQNAEGRFHSARINLTGARNPELTAYVYEICSDPTQESSLNRNEIKLVVCEADSDNWVPIKSGTVHELVNNPRHWGRVRADLSAYKGKVIMVGLQVKSTHYPSAFFDQLRVAETVGHDLRAAEAQVTRNVMAGQPASVGVWVENCGGSDVSGADFKVELYRNDDKTPFQEIPGQNLAPCQNKLFSHDFTANPTQAGTATYRAKVVYDADENPDNDSTAALQQSIYVDSSMPAPTSLTAALNAKERAVLNWRRPLVEEIPQTTIERFNDLTPFVFTDKRTDAGWYFVNADGLPRVNIPNCDIPNLAPGTTVGWFCVDDKNPYIQASAGNMYSHSANKFMVAMSVLKVGPSPKADDWMISPRLSGRAQTITFYAKAAYSAEETVEMLYTDKEDAKTTSAYKSVGTATFNKGGLWESRSFDVPEGATYFALRYTSPAAQYMIHIDDVTYEPKRETPIDVVGFNVYRDSVRVTDTLLTEPAFVDRRAPAGKHVYNVTAMYNNGLESSLSESASITTFVTAADADCVNVYADGNTLCVDNAADRTQVYDVTGICRYAGSEGNLRLRLPAGIYIVRTGGKTWKITM